ncbi:MAG: nitrous oxide-stimulated promoter family protein [Oscillibacter sp.]|nr:nitrous oxide-stimulated promoter family protein [Oscillibacter sp.]
MADSKAQQRLEAKREREKAVVSQMIALYCRKQHRTKGGLCPKCAELASYARRRVDSCPFMESKTFCSNCHTQCYRVDMRERIRTVMRFSGPRMLLYYPVMTLHHMASVLAEKRRMKRPAGSYNQKR